MKYSKLTLLAQFFVLAIVAILAYAVPSVRASSDTGPNSVALKPIGHPAACSCPACKNRFLAFNRRA